MVRYRDWHAWAWKDDGIGVLGFAFVQRNPPTYDMRGRKGGRWVRVKFVIVEPPQKQKQR